jgi:hypothetical protein|tara:strand:+ start:263 stop:1012 length:750 start_codon:yes stop_codon:yes gene_type:complete
MLLLGSLGFVANVLATSENLTTETSSYYEDNAEFVKPIEGSDNGWGWQNEIKAVTLAFCDSDTDCGGVYTDPPKDVAPSVPQSIAVQRQGGSDSVTVQWRGGSQGQGTSFRYELYKQYKGQYETQSDTETQDGTQAPQRVYYGTSLKSIQNPGSNKTVSYSVRACNSVGCSPYAASTYYAINATYDNGGAITQELEKLSSTTSGLAARTTQSEQDTALAALSKGFDALKGEVYGNACWNVSGEAQIDSV